jgi:hypothetical protein
LVQTYPVPTNLPWDPDNGTNIWWTVFSLTYDGTNTAITPINTAGGNPAPYPDSTLRAAGNGMPAKTAGGEGARKARGGKRKRRGRTRR